MTDRQFVESTVSYLAEHVPWMWVKFRKVFSLESSNTEDLIRALWDRARRAADKKLKQTTGWLSDWSQTRWESCKRQWAAMAKWLRTELHTQTDPLVSADWWEERGEPKLAELLRKQNEKQEAPKTRDHNGVTVCVKSRAYRQKCDHRFERTYNIPSWKRLCPKCGGCTR